jgi:hypothetical protein
MCLLPIPFLAIGACLTWVMVTEFYLERQSKDWPRASGVLHVEVGEYRKELSYQYRVDGVDYSSSRVVFGELGNRTRSREWEEVGRRPDGSAVEVFYMPDNPQESTLITQLCERASSSLQTGLAFLGIGSLAVIFIPLVLKRIAEQAAPSNGEKRPV